VVLDRGILHGALNVSLNGYEIHMGKTHGAKLLLPFCIDKRSRRPCEELEGCMSLDGNVMGTYLHGLFHNKELRRSILVELATRKGVPFRPAETVLSKEEQYDRLAALVRSSLNMDCIYRTVDLKRAGMAYRHGVEFKD
jgi:adenosylcobyric acid synthase